MSDIKRNCFLELAERACSLDVFVLPSACIFTILQASLKINKNRKVMSNLVNDNFIGGGCAGLAFELH